MSLFRRFFWTLIATGSIAFAGTVNHKPHVHGSARLVLALDSATQGSIALDVPADSIYGFEHEAHTAQDKATQKAGLQKLRDGAAQVIVFPPALGCSVTASGVGLEKEEHEAEPQGNAHEGEHADVNASYAVTCARAVAGAQVTIGLMQLFPRIKSVSFQVLSSSGQNETKVQNALQSIGL